ncbi:Lactate utilization protein A [Alphaproteobacteria bacterium SO-S41]|nr:Lactate utilization protein A [Alphaproteobacteria bacterium SO-S41]
MRTGFSDEQLQDPGLAEAAQAIRSCVHCGMCNATCPTYQVVADERDGPRGRIQLMQAMLEQGGTPSETAVHHIDRCLTCLSCRTTCPSSVDYSRLVDEARIHIAENYRRPFGERWFRTFLATVLPRPGLFKLAMKFAPLAKPLNRLLPAPFRRMAAMAPAAPIAGEAPRPGVYPAIGPRKMRVAMVRGCVQRVLAPEIDHAAIRLLNRLGAEVVIAAGSGCCGALNHHLGLEASAKRYAKANVAAWSKLHENGGIDRIVSTASGCGTLVKDYAHLLARDAGWVFRTRKLAPLVRDISELVEELGYTGAAPEALTVAYHTACSLQHGQRLAGLGERLLAKAGFTLAPVRDSHLCCGSAGHYSLLQPEMSGELRSRKLKALTARGPKVIASGNIGCLEHLRAASDVPLVHTIELLDWAAGGLRPPRLPALP